MKAYAILDGGGVKGAALAGGLAAAEGQGIEFVGYGGTSAGSIIALLASIGYTGDNLRDAMLNRIKPMMILDDKGNDLREGRAYLQRMIGIIESKRWWFPRILDFRRLAREANPLLRRLWDNGGLYTGEETCRILLDTITTSPSKLAHLSGKTDVTFADLEDSGCTPLKIVASDVTGFRSAVHSLQDTQYGKSVIQAVRASISYPFVFQPVKASGGQELCDGGLSSNLPTFLFAEECEVSRYPIFAFDLVSDRKRTSDVKGLRSLVSNILGTALEASDDLLVHLIPNAHRIEIPVPAGIDTLDFELEDSQIETLFNSGHTATTRFLNEFAPLTYSQQAGDKLQRQLQVMYGDQKLFAPVLWALANMMELRTRAREIRSQITLPTGRMDRSRIITYNYGFRPGDADSDLELDEFGGCTGRALASRSPTIADLEDARTNFEKWGMTVQQQGKVAADRKSMISVPISPGVYNGQSGANNLHIFGELSVDSSTPLAATGWMEPSMDPASLNIRSEVIQIMTAWADVVGKLLR